jgi:uncharacterized protein
MDNALADKYHALRNLEPPLLDKIAACQAILRAQARVVVAFSGGVDSTFLLAMAIETLGPKNVLAVTNTSAIHPRADTSQARTLAEELGVEMVEVMGQELENHNFRDNPPERCYHCKLEIFTSLKRLAELRGYNAVLSGTNADDSQDYRPGAKAEDELGTVRPLKDAGLTKMEIRAASRAMGLPTADMPSMACLASRIPYGQPITAQKLARIERAETLLTELGIRQHRVRDHEILARIEVLPIDMDLVLRHRQRIVDELKGFGYTYITIDLQGFRSGSMNETLPGLGGQKTSK